MEIHVHRDLFIYLGNAKERKEKRGGGGKKKKECGTRLTGVQKKAVPFGRNCAVLFVAEILTNFWERAFRSAEKNEKGGGGSGESR